MDLCCCQLAAAVAHLLPVLSCNTKIGSPASKASKSVAPTLGHGTCVFLASCKERVQLRQVASFIHVFFRSILISNKISSTFFCQIIWGPRGEPHVHVIPTYPCQFLGKEDVTGDLPIISHFNGEENTFLLVKVYTNFQLLHQPRMAMAPSTLRNSAPWRSK